MMRRRRRRQGRARFGARLFRRGLLVSLCMSTFLLLCTIRLRRCGWNGTNVAFWSEALQHSLNIQCKEGRIISSSVKTPCHSVSLCCNPLVRKELSASSPTEVSKSTLNASAACLRYDLIVSISNPTSQIDAHHSKNAGHRAQQDWRMRSFLHESKNDGDHCPHDPRMCLFATIGNSA